MRNAILAVGLVLTGFAATFAQAPGQGLSFDVASVKPSAPPDAIGRIFIGGQKGGPGTSDPGQITWSSTFLLNVLTFAYDLKPYQINGPDWLRSERYDFVAKVPAGATKEQVKVMWQNLLTDRFRMVTHKDSKEFQVQELTVAKGGPKLKPTDLDPNAPPPAPFQPGPNGELPPPPKMDANGFPQLPGPGLIVMIGPSPNGQMLAHMTARARSMTELTDILGLELNKPVVDKTGLTGKYDFNIEYTPDLAGRGLPPPPPGLGPGPGGVGGGAPGEAAEPGSNLASAIQQLGLRLSTGKAKLDLLVIDKVEKTPTEN